MASDTRQSSESGTNNSPIVHLRVGEEQKQRWEDFVGDSDLYTSLSDFIRKSVEKEINDDEQRVTELSDEISEVQSSIEELGGSIEEVQEQLEWIEHDAVSDSIADLAHDVLDVLIPLRKEKDTPQEQAINSFFTEANGQTQTLEDIAERVESNPKRVEKALEHLKNQFLLETVELDGETHYFKVSEQ
jgi:archaellum component FlaC